MFLFAFLAVSKLSSQTISADVTAPWNEPSVFDQILFFLNDREASKIPEFILKATEYGKIADDDVLLEKASEILPKHDFNHLKTYIQVGFYVPRSVTFKELANTEEAIFVTGEKPSFDFDGQFLPNSKEKIFDFDIYFGFSKCVVYADFSNKDCVAFIKKLILDKNSFILRPISKTASKTVKLSGFSARIKRIDTPENKTDKFSDYNVSTIPDFDLKFTQYVLDSHKKLPAAIKDIVTNWPKSIAEIEAIVPTEEANKSLSSIQSILKETKTTSTLNGRIVPMDIVDTYTLLGIINEESNIYRMLSEDLDINGSVVDRLMSVTYDDRNNFLLDYRNEFVRYMNNIETDPKTASWGTSFNELIMPKSGVPHIRKNLLNIITYVDPTTNYGLTQLFTVAALIQIGLPVRVGIVPNFNLGNRLQRRVAFAFHHLSIANEPSGIFFLIEAFKKAGIDKESQKLNPITEKIYADAYRIVSRNLPCLPWEKLYTLYSPLSEEYQTIKRTNKYYEDSHIPYGYATVNGKAIVNLHTSMENLVKQVRDMLTSVAECAITEGIRDFANVDVLHLLSNKYTIVQSLKRDVFDKKTVGTGITKKSRETMKEFINFLENTEWQKENKAKNYVILFCNEEEDTEIFEHVVERGSRIAYAINPPVTGRLTELFNFDKATPTIVANGRIFSNVNLSDKSFIGDIIEWASHFSVTFNNVLQNEKNKFIPVSVMTTIAADWASRDIVRMMIPGVAFTGNSELISSEQRKNLLSWNIFIDPTSHEYQATSELIAYCSSHDILNVNMLVVPPSVIPLSAHDTINSYYRTSLASPKLTFKFLEPNAKYEFIPEVPFTWSIEKLKEEFDTSIFTVDAVDDGDRKVSYLINGIFTQGTAKIDQKAADHIHLAAYQNEKIVAESTTNTRGIWRVATPPGKIEFKLADERMNTIYNIDSSEYYTTTFRRENRNIKVHQNSELTLNDVPQETIEEDVLNVYTMLSGKKSERLAKSMMLSVVKSTKEHVKFWFIKEDATPEFKAILPQFAKDNGFEYEYISFMWPDFVKMPRETSSIISAKKILFLDQMFPSSVKNVVFVDVDQIVTGDLAELVNVELKNTSFALPSFATINEGAKPPVKSILFREFLKKGSHKTACTSIFALNIQKLREMSTFDAFRMQYNQFAATLTTPDFDLLNMLHEALNGTVLSDRRIQCIGITNESENTISSGRCMDPSEIRELNDFDENAPEGWSEYDAAIQNYKAESDKYYKDLNLIA